MLMQVKSRYLKLICNRIINKLGNNDKIKYINYLKYCKNSLFISKLLIF